MNPKKSIYRSIWKLETDKNLLTILGAWGGERGEGRKGKEGEEGLVEENLREWDSRNGERTEMKARKEIA